ncbi:MAG: MFS transporter [Saccharospirillum sp.]
MRSATLLVALAFIAFVSLGLPDGLLGVAWPSMRADFGQPLDALGLLLISTTAGYMLSSFFSGPISRWLGIGRLLGASCAATGLALLSFTWVDQWVSVILIGTVIGASAGAIDAGLNTYIAVNHSERLMQWLHASFGVGITLGPLIMTGSLDLFDSWRVGYWVVGSAQIGLGIAFLLTAGVWHTHAPVAKAAAGPDLTDDGGMVSAAGPVTDAKPVRFRASLLHLPVWLSMGLFYCYTGLELTLGLWGYSLLTEARAIEPGPAGLWIAVYWGMFTLGRMVAGVFANHWGNHRLVIGSLVLAFCGTLLLIWNPLPQVGLLAIGLLGFAFAPIFPAMVSGTVQRVGPSHVANTMGMQIAAAGIGAASLPALAGWLSAQLSLEIIPWYLAAVVLLLSLIYTMARKLRAEKDASIGKIA